MPGRVKDNRFIVEERDRGVKPFVARLVGLNSEYGFDRQFLGVRHLTQGPYADAPAYQACVTLDEGAAYEFGNWGSNPGEKNKKFFLVTDGRPVPTTSEEVAKVLGAVEAPDDAIPF
jgi:hypothetical protein